MIVKLGGVVRLLGTHSWYGTQGGALSWYVLSVRYGHLVCRIGDFVGTFSDHVIAVG